MIVNAGNSPFAFATGVQYALVLASILLILLLVKSNGIADSSVRPNFKVYVSALTAVIIYDSSIPLLNPKALL